MTIRSGNPQSGVKYMLAGAMAALLVSSSSAQFSGRRGGGADVEMSARFDRDKNGYLDKAERKAAYEALTGSGQRGYRGSAADTAPRNPKLTPAQVKSWPGKPLFDPGTLRTLFLNFEDSDWEAQMMAYKGTDIEMPATASVDGKNYKDVGVHFRGQTSFMSVPEGYKHSMKVSFDFIDKKQNLLGYGSLELLNAAGDPSFLRNVLYMQVARDYIAAPKANFMRVVINGENWGIYVNSQPFNGDFVKEVTGASGARWKVPGSPNARGGLEYFGDNLDYYKSVFEITSKDKPESWAALVNLTRVLNTTPPGKLEAALKPILDIDGALHFLAIDNALINNDGYWTRASDYSIYQDKSGVFHVTPHDANETFRETERMGRRRGNSGGGATPSSGIALDPLVSINDSSKPLLSKLLAAPALRQRYLSYVRDLSTKWLDWNKLGPIAVQYQALIADDVRQDQRKLDSTESFNDSLTKDGTGGGFGMLSAPGLSFKSFVQQRQAYLQSYFATNGNAVNRTGI
jgi:CotH kinase protein